MDVVHGRNSAAWIPASFKNIQRIVHIYKDCQNSLPPQLIDSADRHAFFEQIVSIVMTK